MSGCDYKTDRRRARLRRDMTRRSMLKALGTATLATAAGPMLVDAFGGLSANAHSLEALADPLARDTPILLAIDVDGGNDSLNMLCPVDDPWYYDDEFGHGSLAIPAGTALSLERTKYRMHPAMPWLRNRWNKAGDVAFIEGVGENVHNQFSHFEAQDQWHSGSFDLGELTGWLGRYNDRLNPGAPLSAIALGEMHPMLVGDSTSVLAVLSVEWFRFRVDWRADSHGAFMEAIEAMGGGAHAGVVGDASAAIAQTVQAQERIQSTFDETLLDGVDDWLAEQLVQAAMMIRGGIPCQTYVARHGGFDTHDNQAWTHEERLATLDAALDAFFAALAGSHRAKDVVVLLHSEFGRKISRNGSAGTDHGQAGTATLVGPRVHGGLYGDAPTLDPGGPTRPNRIDDSMVPTVDFRSVLGTCLNFLADDAGMAAEVIDEPQEELGMLHAWKPDSSAPVAPPVSTSDPPRPGPPVLTVPAPVEAVGSLPGRPPMSHTRAVAAARANRALASAKTDDESQSGGLFDDIGEVIRHLHRGRPSSFGST